MDLNVYINDTLLDQSQHEIFVHLLPVIVFLAISAFVGILGNILTIIFYASKCKRCAFTIQIACLASVDLLVCCMIVPHVIEMVVNVKHNQRFLCKLTKIFGMWTISSSCLILWIIALNRYRRICKPFTKQMKVKTTIHCFIGIVAFSFFLSVRNFANFDINKVNVPVPGSNGTTNGLYCTTRDDSGYKMSVFVFTLIDFLLMMMILVTIIVCYTRIICTLLSLNHTKKRDCPSTHAVLELPVKASEREDSEVSTEIHDSKSQSETCNTIDSETADFQVSDDTRVASRLDAPYTISAAPNLSRSHFIPTISDGKVSNNQNGGMAVSGTKTQKRKSRHKIAARSATERNLTFMMFTVSFLFILCFFPYFVVKIIMRFVLKSGEEFELDVGIQFALRLVYFNSVFNPVVYCFFNPQFRRYIKNLFLRCLRCRMKN